MGMERVLLVMEAANVAAASEPHAFVVHAGEGAELAAWGVAEKLRDAGLDVVLGSGGSFKSQMKRADASGARYAVIIGDSEATSGQVTVKDLRKGADQQTVDLQAAIQLLG
jgi:histidyl-tRNA synthetase